PMALVGGLAAFVAFQASGATGSAVAREHSAASHEDGGAMADSGSSRFASGAGSGSGSLDLKPGTPASTDAESEAARRERRAALEALAPDTYLPRIIADGEHVITRWQTATPVRVWVSPASTLRGWHPRMVAAAREAFDDWRAAVPVEFRFVDDSAGAQVIVTWRDSFQADSRDGGLVGHARRHYTPDGWVAAAEVSLAVHAVDGSALSPELIRAAALHEAGHVIGLPHSDQPEDIMAPSHSGVVSRLSARDIRTARELYRMLPGRI
ncbi:MAG TPA: matrixin family metalloprotease, partial [Gemmatimonadales bacterium]|nr:matrixin family metalloprotease [Gemmatimonadales bacterium]